MPSRKRTKTKRKSKSEDRSRIIECVEEQEEGPRVPDHSLEQHNVKNQVPSRPKGKSKAGGEKCSKEVHFAFLPDKYEQLIEENDSKVKSKEEELEKRRLKYKKIRKNVGKAVRFSWKCLVVGLQTFASVYSTPLSAATTIIPEMNRTPQEHDGMKPWDPLTGIAWLTRKEKGSSRSCLLGLEFIE